MDDTRIYFIFEAVRWLKLFIFQAVFYSFRAILPEEKSCTTELGIGKCSAIHITPLLLKLIFSATFSSLSEIFNNFVIHGPNLVNVNVTQKRSLHLVFPKYS